MRLKSRYYIFRIEYGGADALSAAESTSLGDVFASLRSSIQDVFGDAGWGHVASNIAVTNFWPKVRMGVVRGPLSADAEVRAGLALIKLVRKRAAAVHVEAVTGSARSLKDLLERNALGADTAITTTTTTTAPVPLPMTGAAGATAGSGATIKASLGIGIGAGADAPVLDEAFFLALEAQEAEFE